MIKKCPKCNKEFNCRNDETFECHCIHVPVSEEAQRYLAENYKDCLCNSCLHVVADMFSTKLIHKKVGEAKSSCCNSLKKSSWLIGSFDNN